MEARHCNKGFAIDVNGFSIDRIQNSRLKSDPGIAYLSIITLLSKTYNLI